MTIRTVGTYQNRINLLQSRDPIMNKNIIKKLQRRIRALENKK